MSTYIIIGIVIFVSFAGFFIYKKMFNSDPDKRIAENRVNSVMMRYK